MSIFKSVAVKRKKYIIIYIKWDKKKMEDQNDVISIVCLKKIKLKAQAVSWNLARVFSTWLKDLFWNEIDFLK